MSKRTLRVGMLGFGTVGSGVYRMLEDNRVPITNRIGFPVEIAKVGVRNVDKRRPKLGDLVTCDLESIVADPSIDVILELMGGTDPASGLVEKALFAGKSVVTANKELMAKEGARLVKIARDRNLDLHFEAAVGGGIPLVQPLKHQLAGNDVLKLMGILNGTCNFILTKMTEEGLPLSEVLKDAQSKGFAEANPSNDIDGIDTAYKLAVLIALAYGKLPDVQKIYCEGIRGLKPEEFFYAKLLGFRIKLLGIAHPVGPNKVLARVHPTLIPLEHPIANVMGVHNALWLQGDFVGDLMFSGKGAGGDPTASAVVGDLIDVGRNLAVNGPGSAIVFGDGLETEEIGNLETCFYVRLRVNDQPKVLGEIATLFGNADVSLSAMEMKVVSESEKIGEIVFLTHRCRESAFQKALNGLRNSTSIKSIDSFLRVEQDVL